MVAKWKAHGLGITTGSNRSLRSLGRAKARPLTKRYIAGATIVLAALKPSLRRIGATALIIVTTFIYVAVNSALTKETKAQMSAAFLGEPALSKIKELRALSCERDEQISKFTHELAELNSEKMLSARNRMFAINLSILALCAYLSSCLIVPRKPAEPAI
jgi:hypothetical protein